ncbi:MAG TPA: M13 family metallopeptidase [Myxococcaceae bacterium]|jgi:endothelin-converting enzyme/putative endopeptidase
MKTATRSVLPLALLALASCTAPAAAPAGKPPDVDRKIDPCTDFDAYANGPWRAANPIPAQESRWGRRAESRETNRRQVQELLQEFSTRDDLPRGSIERLLADHYASCMDEAKIEALGVTPLAPLLADIDAIRSRADLQRSIRRLHALAIPVGFGLAGAMDYHEPEHFIANVSPGGLGLTSRDAYLRDEPPAVEARERYRARVAQLLTLAGSPDVAARESSVAILGLEKRLAEASLDARASADPAATDHRVTFSQLQQLAPNVDWSAYFAEAGLPRVDLNVEQPNLLRRLDVEIRETPLPVWKAYLRWKFLDSASPFLPKSFADGSETTPRSRRCLESTESLFGDALGRKYVERHFPPAAKARLQEMIRAMQTVLKDDIAGSEWMRPETRKTALEKLEGYDVQVGYPEQWKDYSGVEVRRDALWANVAAGRRFNVDADRKRIGKPTERDLWQLPPSSPGAYIDVQLNQMVLPAGFLQPPAFGLAQSDAENYGAIGSSIAHDLTHAIDAGGSELDLHGRPRPWWTEADRQEFQARGRCVSEQFEGYFIEPGVHHKGSLVLSEAIGDLAGVRVAFVAFRQSLAKHPMPTRVGPTPEQRFFIAFGQMRGDAMRLEAQRQLLATDPHPAPKFRVVGTLSNLPEFQRAFSCPAGAEMVRPPEKRCAVVW